MSEVYLRDPDLTLWHGDVLETLQQLGESSIDCCITSPPYWGLRNYGMPGQIGLEPTPERYVERMVEVFREVRRVLRKHGTLWLNIGNTYAANRSYQVPDSKHTDVGNEMASVVPAGYKPKDLIGVPWLTALALQRDGWYLRSDIIWSKANPMPESTTDRPTNSHEYIFLLSKNERYFFDQEPVREPFSEHWKKTWEKHPRNPLQSNSDSPYRQSKRNTHGGGVGYPDAEGRNIRTVWHLTAQPFAGAHFAVFPEELVRRALLAGCPEKVCEECGRPSERIVEKEKSFESGSGQAGNMPTGKQDLSQAETNSTPDIRMGPTVRTRTVGWTDCGHNAYRPGVVLDPFGGSGTTAFVARKQGRHSVLIELNTDYCEIISKRLAQQSLFA